MAVLVTRPEPGAARTAALLAARGLEVVSAPLFAIEMTMARRPAGRFDALLVTSGNGAAGLSPALAGLGAKTPVLAVGDRTAEAMRGNGFADVRSASGDQRELAALAVATLPAGASVLIAAGEDRKPGLEDALKQAGFAVAVWVRYRAPAVAALPEAARAALADGRITHVLHYSRRAAEAFARLVAPMPPGLTHLCLSPDVAEGLGKFAGQPAGGVDSGRLRIASAPDEAHLIELIDAVGDARPLQGPGSVGDGAEQYRGTGPDMAAGEDKSRGGDLGAGQGGGEEARDGATGRRRRKDAADAPAADRVASDASAQAGSEAPPPVPLSPPPFQDESLPPPPVPPEPSPPPQTAPQPQPRAGFGLPALAATGLLAAIAGGLVAPWLQPVAERFGAPGPAKTSDRLTQAPASATAAADPELTRALRAIEAETQRARQQVQALEQRLADLAARPPAAAPAQPDPAQPDPALAEMRERLLRAEAAAQGAGQAAAALAPRLQQVERAAQAAAQTAGVPSPAATAAAKMVMAERLGRVVGEGRPFQTELAALRAVGAAPERLQALEPLAAGGAPAMPALLAAFRQARAAMTVEPAGTELSFVDRLLKLTDGLVRVRATGQVEGATPSALTARMEQALQRADAAAALGLWEQLPEPGRRASEAFAALLRSRAAADGAVRAIMDDAVRALAGNR